MFPDNNTGERTRHLATSAGAVFCMLFLSGCSGLFSSPSEYEQAQQKDNTFSGLITAAGGTATKKGAEMAGLQGSGWFIGLGKATITDELLAALAEENRTNPVFQLNLSGSTITDAQLARLDSDHVLQKVFVLDLSDTAITDAGLDQLQNVYCISELKLKGSKATAAAAKRLGERKIASPQTPQVLKTPPQVDI